MKFKSIAGKMSRDQRLTLELVSIQAVVALVIAALWLLNGFDSACAALVGGFIAVILNGFSAWMTFRNMENRNGKQILVAMYVGELVKMVASAVFAVLVISFLSLSAFPLLTGLAGTYIIYAPVAIYKQLKMVKI